MNNGRIQILTIKDLPKLRYPVPESMIRAAGLLKGRKINSLRYQKKIRQEWEQRFKKLVKQYGSR